MSRFDQSIVGAGDGFFRRMLRKGWRWSGIGAPPRRAGDGAKPRRGHGGEEPARASGATARFTGPIVF